LNVPKKVRTCTPEDPTPVLVRTGQPQPPDCGRLLWTAHKLKSHENLTLCDSACFRLMASKKKPLYRCNLLKTKQTRNALHEQKFYFTENIKKPSINSISHKILPLTISPDFHKPLQNSHKLDQFTQQKYSTIFTSSGPRKAKKTMHHVSSKK